MMEELSPQDEPTSQPMSEKTKDIIVEQGNIEAFECTELTDQTQCENGCRHMSVGDGYCHRGRILPGASEEVQRQILKNVMQNFELLTTSSAFRIKMEPSRGNTDGASEETKNMAKPRTLWKSQKKKTTVPSLNAPQMTTHYLQKRSCDST